MIDDTRLEQRLQNVADEVTPDDTFTEAVMDRIARTQVAPPRRSISRVWPAALSRPRRVVVAACALAVAVVWIWPFGSQSGTGNWWLGPSAAYAQEITHTLEQAKVDGIVARSTTTFLMNDGNLHTSSTVSTYFFKSDRYRLDIYDEGRLREIQWYVPEGDELVQTSFRLQDGSTDVVRHRPEEPRSDPISNLLTLVQRFDEADRRFDPKEIEGRQCVGFEISSDKTDAGTDRVWFDTQTKRPVLLEFDRPMSNPHMQRMILTFDRFEWNTRLPADTFSPHPVGDAAALEQD